MQTPPPPQHLNETKFFGALGKLNTKSTVAIENIGMQTLFRQLIL